ncbi:MAG: CocE/NonD family hydrolase [Reichenbachiella sp.]
MNYTKIALFILTLSVWSACETEKETYSPERTEQDVLFAEANYDKKEVMVPMRDGTNLFTSIYSPKDQSQTYPMVMMRTPYSVKPYGPDVYKEDLGPNPEMMREKYIFVYQDVRGRFRSQGEFVDMTPHNTIIKGQHINESTDTFDTIEWLLANLDNNNGNVGQWGISYPGFYTAAGMIDSHPALKAVSPQAPIADWFFDDFHHNGAFFPSHAFAFLSRFGAPSYGLTDEFPPLYDFGDTTGYDFYLNATPLSKIKENYLGDSIAIWDDMVAHPNYDEYWQDRNILQHLNNVNCAVLTVGGWYDAEDLYGPLNIYQAVEENNPKINNTIVVGPWGHGNWRRTEGDFLGDVHFGQKTSTYYNNEVLSPFFRYHLKNEGDLDLPEAMVFQTGTNEWKAFDSWPPENITYSKMYFKQKNELSYTPPKDNEFGADMFTSDPSNPVPFTQYPAHKIPKEYMVEDQGFLVSRNDVLYYLTEVLTEDLTIAGPIMANLVVKTSETAADWVVKIIDVYPTDHAPFPHQPEKAIAGYHQMVRSEVIRGRFRNSFKKPEPFTPKQEETVELKLQDVLHTFKKGHRLMVQVHSTWFPLVDINPQTYVDNIFEATAEDFVTAKHFVGRSGSDPSYIKIGILKNE